MRTQDLDEAIEAVTEVYCPHSIEIARGARRIDARLTVERPTYQPVVQLSYDAPVNIDAGNFSGLFLMMTCARGAASTVQEGRSAEWSEGQTMPFSAGLDTHLQFDRRFVQRGVRLDMDKLESQCRRLLGRALNEPLRLALAHFSEDMESAWQRALAFLASDGERQLALSPAAKAAFDEFLLTLLLDHHPHNYSDEIAQGVPVPIPGLVRRAERYMAENAKMPITVSDVADHLGVSLRSLQSGFRSWRNTTPTAYLRQVRLHRVRDDLLRPEGDANVTTVALRYGFAHLGRFGAYYRSVFGEAPSDTRHRARASKRR